MAKYKIINDNLFFNGMRYEIGDEVEFSAEDAKAIGSDNIEALDKKAKTPDETSKVAKVAKKVAKKVAGKK